MINEEETGDMAKTNFFAGTLDRIEFVVIFTKYKDKWVYCWHKKRESYEHPGGHVEANETPMQAAKRELCIFGYSTFAGKSSGK